MPPPYSHSSYDKIVKEIAPCVTAMNNSMVAAAKNFDHLLYIHVKKLKM